MNNKSLDKVVQQLEEDIIFGRLHPREHLVEENLMKRFGAKRHLVRQALFDLEIKGIVTRERNRGAMVREFSLEEVEEIHDMRMILLEQGASRIPLPVDPGLIEQLTGIHRRHSAAVDDENLWKVYKLNDEFHATLFGACGNRYLSDSISYYMWLTTSMRCYPISNPSLVLRMRDEHGKMIEALENGARDTLVQLCVDHIKPSKNAYLAARKTLDPFSRDSEKSEKAVSTALGANRAALS